MSLWNPIYDSNEAIATPMGRRCYAMADLRSTLDSFALGMSLLHCDHRHADQKHATIVARAMFERGASLLRAANEPEEAHDFMLWLHRTQGGNHANPTNQ